MEGHDPAYEVVMGKRPTPVKLPCLTTSVYRTDMFSATMILQSARQTTGHFTGQVASAATSKMQTKR